MSEIKKIETNPLNHIKHIIAISSGKGGVGKSFVTSLIASSLSKVGYKVGIIDGDIVGASIPKSFGVKESLSGDQNGLIFPSLTKEGIKIVSSNLMIPHEDDPIIWRGQLIVSLLIQFYKDVLWEELDYLLIDMPPGTSDITLSTYQSIPLDGVLIVSTPQDLVKLIVTKSIKMAEMMNIPILGMIENMSYIKCPKCDERIELFGKSKLKEICFEHDIDTFISLPLDPKHNELVDKGKVSEIKIEELDEIIDKLRSL